MSAEKLATLGFIALFVVIVAGLVWLASRRSPQERKDDMEDGNE